MDKQQIKEFYTYLQSEQTAQLFLFNCYQKIEGVDPETKSYENCNSFMYYIDHGNQFYKNGQKINIVLKPILLFYGMVHLLKASLLTKRPDYPETTKVLSHGVSTRKRKKKQYLFMNDEVRVQHNGLFPYFSEHLFSTKDLYVDKFNMNLLLSVIPEMSPLFSFQKQQKMIIVGKTGSNLLTFPIQLLDNYHLTAKAFLQRVVPYLSKVKKTTIDKNQIHIQLLAPLIKSSGPFFIEMNNKNMYFPIDRKHFLSISEVMVHYLLLYNLSMLCRYETEWWGDLLITKADVDYPFISYFLHHTTKKIPFLLGQLLYEEFLTH